MATWYVYQNNVQTGPVNEEQLPAMGLTRDTLVWREGMDQWLAAGQLPELAFLFEAPSYGGSAASTPPPAPGPEPQACAGPQFHNAPYGACPPPGAYLPQSGKDKVTAGILAILLGVFGAQYFYLGKTGAAFITILLSFVTCGLWNLLTFAQGIVMLTMSQEQFDQKYVYTNSSFPLF